MYVSDVDDVLFPLESGFHAAARLNTVSVFNGFATSTSAQERHIFECFETAAERRGVEVENISSIHEKAFDMRVFFAMIDALKEVYDAEEQAFYLTMLYGFDNYNRIEENPAIVRATDRLIAADVDMFLYTNGPSSDDPDVDFHTQHVMRRVGYGQTMIDFFRSRTYDLQKSADRDAGKPEIEGMRNFLEYFGIRDDAIKAMADDNIRNITTAGRLGLTPIWAHTADSEPDIEHVQQAFDIGAVRVRHPEKIMEQIALAA